MKKRIFSVVLIIALVFIALQVFALPVLVKSSYIQGQIVRHMEKMTGGTFTSGPVQVNYFPLLTVEIQDAEYHFKNDHILKAPKIRIGLAPLSLLMGRAQISRLEIRDGEATLSLGKGTPWPEAKLEHIRFCAAWGIRRSRVRVTVEGSFAGVPKMLSGEAVVTLSGLSAWNWKASSAEGTLSFQNFPMAELTAKTDPKTSLKITGGEASGKTHFHKAAGQTDIDVDSQVKIQRLVYQMWDENSYTSSPVITSDLNFELSWDPVRDELELVQGVLALPVGTIEGKGHWIIGTGEIKDMRVTVSEMVLESIPQYWIPFKKIVPFNIGFSGQSSLELRIEGTLDHLVLHANWDLTPALLTYARYFYKPKDLPMNVAFDYVLQDGEKLLGDFSVRFQDANIKGNLAGLNLKTGQGEFNLISNKFSLAPWQGLLPPFQKYELGGEVKVLLNLAGNLQRLHETKLMLNLTMDNATVIRQGGSGVRNAKIAMDYGLVSFEMRGNKFEVNGAPVFLDLKVYNLISQNPTATVKVTSPRLDLLAVTDAVRDLVREWVPENWVQGIDLFREKVGGFFPSGQFAEEFSAELDYGSGKWALKNLGLTAYDGTLKADGQLDLASTPQRLTLNSEINRLSLARFLARTGSEEKLLNGNLFLSSQVQGERPFEADGINRLTGRGVFSLTNGEFRTFDIVKTLAGIPEFSALGAFAGGTTLFDDVHSEWELKNGKINTPKLLVISKDVLVQAGGEIALNGLLNYRMDTYLSSMLANQFLPDPLKEPADSRERFGPVPLLLAGYLDKPELKPDPALMPQLLAQILKNKPQKIFRDFLPEELFFGKQPKS